MLYYASGISRGGTYCRVRWGCLALLVWQPTSHTVALFVIAIVLFLVHLISGRRTLTP